MQNTYVSENLYIQVKNGMPYQHPVTESNLRMLYPDLDPDMPPEGFEKFIRNPTPEVGPFDVYEGTEYLKIDGIYQDHHKITSMTSAQKQEKIRVMRETFPFANTWSLNETTGVWTPPKPAPNVDGRNFIWSDQQMDWIEINPYITSEG